MRQEIRSPWPIGLAILVALVATGTLGGFLWRSNVPARAANVPQVVQDFGRQKIIYHLAEAGDDRPGRQAGWLGSMLNHYAALQPGALDMAVVMNGEGVELLRKAQSDKDLQSRITKLKALGARFLVCRNTLISRGLDPAADLYDVHTGDIVVAGVAEIALLEAEGYGYIKP